MILHLEFDDVIIFSSCTWKYRGRST